MCESLRRFFSVGNAPTELDAFEPIYGLPKRSLDEWLSRNPRLKKEYDAKLRARSRYGRAARGA